MQIPQYTEHQPHPNRWMAPAESFGRLSKKYLFIWKYSDCDELWEGGVRVQTPFIDLHVIEES